MVGVIREEDVIAEINYIFRFKFHLLMQNLFDKLLQKVLILIKVVHNILATTLLLEFH